MSRLLDLPAELRMKILEFVTEDGLCAVSHKRFSGKVPHVMEYTFITPWSGAAQTNKQFNAEVAAALLRSKPHIFGIGMRFATNRFGGGLLHAAFNCRFVLVPDLEIHGAVTRAIIALRVYKKLPDSVKSAFCIWNGFFDQKGDIMYIFGTPPRYLKYRMRNVSHISALSEIVVRGLTNEN